MRPGCRWHRLARALLLALALPAAHAADGDRDLSFSGDGVAWAEWAAPIGAIRRVHADIAADGRIVLGTSVNRDGNRDFAIARLHASGATDNGFGFFGLRTLGFDLVPDGFDVLLGVVALADGRTLLLGSAEAPGGAGLPALARLTAAGNADPSWGVDGRRVVAASPWPMQDVSINAVARQRDGRLVFAGTCRTCPANAPRSRCAPTPAASWTRDSAMPAGPRSRFRRARTWWRPRSIRKVTSWWPDSRAISPATTMCRCSRDSSRMARRIRRSAPAPATCA